MLSTPNVAMTAKYSSITGPKNSPTLAVPCFWITNRKIRIAHTIGSTRCPSPGCATARPSTADSTDTAGVIMLSP